MCLRYTDQPPEVIVEKPKNKYALKDPPDMRSAFLLEVERRNLLMAQSEQRHREEDLAEARLLSEQVPPDPQHGKRVHTWVLVLIPQETIKTTNMPSGDEEQQSSAGTIDEQTSANGGETVANPVTTIFIEPSTGLQFEQSDPRYLGIESVWNHENYYVSREFWNCVVVRSHNCTIMSFAPN